jgi:hypothetical protein
MRRGGALVLIWFVALACDSDRRAAGSGADAGRSERDSGALVADAEAPSCTGADAGLSQHIGIASAPFGTSTLHFTPELALVGAGLDETLEAEENGLLGMSWQRDRTLVLTFGGFWDIEPGQPPIWVETKRIMSAVITGDLDGDGDLDALMVSHGMETTEVNGAAMPALVTRVQAWERAGAGLAQRGDIWTKTPGGLVGMPFAFLDIDGDRNLDIITFMDHELIGYFGDGAFGFERKVLAGSDPALAPPDGYFGAILLRVEDRNGDDLPDLLVVLGAGGIRITFQNIVFLREPTGAFMDHAPPAKFETSPSPIDVGDVTGDGISDVVAQGFQDGMPILRLTASVDATRFAPTRSIEPASEGLKLADLDEDGTLDVMTTVDERWLAQLGRDGSFEAHDLGLSVTPSLLDFTVRPSEGKRPVTLQVLYRVPCDPACDDGCLDRCLTGECLP